MITDSIPSGVNTNARQLTLSAGVWIIVTIGDFTSAVSTPCTVTIKRKSDDSIYGTTRGIGSNGGTLALTAIAELATTTDVVVSVWHRTGTTCTLSWLRALAVRIK